MATRGIAAALALSLVGGVVLADLLAGAVPNRFLAPPALALGSGQGPAGAHCAASPN